MAPPPRSRLATPIPLTAPTTQPLPQTCQHRPDLSAAGIHNREPNEKITTRSRSTESDSNQATGTSETGTSGSNIDDDDDEDQADKKNILANDHDNREGNKIFILDF